MRASLLKVALLLCAGSEGSMSELGQVSAGAGGAHTKDIEEPKVMLRLLSSPSTVALLPSLLRRARACRSRMDRSMAPRGPVRPVADPAQGGDGRLLATPCPAERP